ncbi:MAG: hypothetical protein FJ387_06710 [Verrucomicrobia bacterium]|nr:hypothetical protein [Verrucomicrobiota bacterium]
MLDANQIRKQVLVRTLGSPWVMGPFLLGMTALTAVWALGLKAGLGWFAGLAGLLGAAGAFVTQLVMRGERTARQVTAELAGRQQESQQAKLDSLDRHLSTADEDPRPEAALRDLRALLLAFETAEAGASPVHLATVVELRARAHQLFEHCVRSLDQTGQLWQTAQQLHTPAARQPILDQRERIIAEVQASVQHLSDTLVGLQTLGTQPGSAKELTRMRTELDQSLELAKTVEARVDSLLNENALRDQTLETNLRTKG